MLLSANKYRKTDVEREPHNLFIDFSESILFDGRNVGDINIGLPYPIQDPFIEASMDRKDHLKELLNQKELYYKTFKGAQSKDLFKNVEEIGFDKNKMRYICMPRNLLDLYKFKDPDQDYYSDYMFNRLGGILDSLQINNQLYLVHITSSGTLALLNLNTGLDKNHLTFTTSTPVHNLKSYSFDKKVQIVLVQKYIVTVLEMVNIATYSLIYRHSCKNGIMDAKLNTNNNDHIGILQNNYELSVRNIKSNKVLFVNKNMRENKNRPMMFEFLEKSKLILMGEFSVNILNYENQTDLQTFDPKLMSCNTFCNLKVFGNTLFLASRHYVIKTDLNLMDNFTTFAHTLENPPIFMDLIIGHNQDIYLCLANHFENNKILFTGKAVFSLPYKVPSIKETLIKALIKDASLTFFDKLYERLDFFVTGLKIIELNNKVFLYYTNSLGEIFRQEISYSTISTNGPVDTLCIWIQKLHKPHSTLYVTHKAEMGDAFFFLNRHIWLEKTEGNNNKNIAKFLKKFGNKYDKKTIESTFAKGFCEIWNDSEESEEESSSKVDELEVPFYEKVNCWMEKIDKDINHEGALLNFDQS